jgi:hypothetical protein
MPAGFLAAFSPAGFGWRGSGIPVRLPLVPRGRSGQALARLFEPGDYVGVEAQGGGLRE